MLSIEEKEISFDKISKLVSRCDKCLRMTNSMRVLNRSVGSLDAKIMFIGEAPGRLGADESGIPFHGDQAGHNFEELLRFSQINRDEIYVTNAVLCNPRDENGNNSAPTNIEIGNCSGYLADQIQLLNPSIVVTLGSNALLATKALENHSFSLKTHVRTANNWFNRMLIPLYHPGQRAMLHRSFSNQRSDYQFVAEQIKRHKLNKKALKSASGKTRLDVAIIIEYFFTKSSNYTYFALHKLLYLLEYKSVLKYGYRLTNTYIVRQKDGPYCTDLHLAKLKKSIPTLQSKPTSKTNIIVYKQSNDLFDNSLLNEFEIEDEVRELIDEVLAEHGSKSNAGLKRTVYFTRPMRNILRMEIDKKINLYNSPIIFTTD